MIEISLQEVQKYYGVNQVLKNITFEVNQKERVGLLGSNGVGKTTLFKILAGVETLDGGSSYIRNGAKVGILDQIPDYPKNFKTYDVLHSAFDGLMDIHNQMKQLEELMKENTTSKMLKEYGNLQQLFESSGGYVVESNINRICNGLKIGKEMQDKSFELLSGGEKTRVMLGKLMLESPDILLLDEPTNHLDLSSMEWLEEFLKDYRGTALIISHDRYFLDKVVGRIVEIVDGKVEIYNGNYSYYIKERQKRYENQLARYTEEQKEIKHLEEAAFRMHDWAKRANSGAMHRRAFSIEKRIERMVKTDKPIKEKGIRAAFKRHDFSGKDIIYIRDLYKSYGDKEVLYDLDLLVQKDEKVAILGDNGTGKTTLIKIITGEESPNKGIVRIGRSIKFAYLPQIVTFENENLTVLETVIQGLNIHEDTARNLLAKYKFVQDDVYKAVENLSGGEKSRLRLCIIMYHDVNLLLLDEPTNHLDIDSREWLEGALEEYNGTLVFVSHDRYFINKFGDRIGEVKEGKIRDYYGNYDYYKEKKNSELENAPPEKKQKMKSENLYSKNRKAKEIKKTIMELESQINNIEEKLKNIEIEMENSYSDYEALEVLYKEKIELEEKRDELYDEWSKLSEA